MLKLYHNQEFQCSEEKMNYGDIAKYMFHLIAGLYQFAKQLDYKNSSIVGSPAEIIYDVFLEGVYF